MTDTSVKPADFAGLTFPPPLYAATRIGSFQRGDDTFVVFVGLEKPLVEQLRQKSRDTSDADLQNNTSDFKRFGGGSYEEWYAKKRTPFALVHEASRTLAALAWFGPKPLGRQSLKYLSDEELQKEGQQAETEWHTLVYRAYLPFRGKGLMGDFVRFAMEVYRKQYPQAKLWVGMSANNAASIGLATKLGFKRREDLFDAEKNWVAMTQE